MPRMPSHLEIAQDSEALAHRVARWITNLAAAAGGGGRFTIALSGGSTPRRLYQLLTEAPYRDALPWDRVHWFWGDERFVPWDHPDSNYGMVHAAMLARAPVPASNIHGIAASGSPEEAAQVYEREIKTYYGAEILDPARPLFDIQILGLGPDGHTASLFPGTGVLGERRRWVAEVVGVKSEARVTLTYPPLESSRHAAFLVAGAEKRAVLTRALAGDQELPAARLRPVGELTWFADEAARPQP